MPQFNAVPVPWPVNPDQQHFTGVRPLHNKKIFIGHGHSQVWRELKDFLQDRLDLKYEEFNSESAAGTSTSERLEAMMGNAGFAFIVMTAEDERVDGSLHARDNVIHEAGLFQGRLGFKRAIILKEEGCQEFSNIHGLTHIPFPKNRISAAFEDIRKVLDREGIITGKQS
jgi:predicted nucleotide-binding protein